MGWPEEERKVVLLHVGNMYTTRTEQCIWPKRHSQFLSVSTIERMEGLLVLMKRAVALRYTKGWESPLSGKVGAAETECFGLRHERRGNLGSQEEV